MTTQAPAVSCIEALVEELVRRDLAADEEKRVVP